LADLDPRENRSTVYLCENFNCQLPIFEVAELAKRLDAMECSP